MVEEFRRGYAAGTRKGAPFLPFDACSRRRALHCRGLRRFFFVDPSSSQRGENNFDQSDNARDNKQPCGDAHGLLTYLTALSFKSA
jgi:hypothetical protein